MKGTIDIETAVRHLAAKNGGVRSLSKATGIDAGYLSRLKNGYKDCPSNIVLEKLGLKRHVVYEWADYP